MQTLPNGRGFYLIPDVYCRSFDLLLNIIVQSAKAMFRSNDSPTDVHIKIYTNTPMHCMKGLETTCCSNTVSQLGVFPLSRLLKLML